CARRRPSCGWRSPSRRCGPATAARRLVLWAARRRHVVGESAADSRGRDRNGAASLPLRFGDAVHQPLQLGEAAAPLGQVEHALDEIDGAGGPGRGGLRASGGLARRLLCPGRLLLLLRLAVERLERLALV